MVLGNGCENSEMHFSRQGVPIFLEILDFLDSFRFRNPRAISSFVLARLIPRNPTMGTAPSSLLGIAHHATSAPQPPKSHTHLVADAAGASSKFATSRSAASDRSLESPAVDHSSDAAAAHDAESAQPRFLFISSDHFAASSSTSDSSASSTASSPRDGQRTNSSDCGSDARSRSGRLSSSPISAGKAPSVFAGLDDVESDDDERMPLRPMRVTRVSRDRALSDHLSHRAQRPRNQQNLQRHSASYFVAVQPSEATSTCRDMNSHSFDSTAHISNSALVSTATPTQRALVSSTIATLTTTDATPPASGRTTPSFGVAQPTSSAYQSPARPSTVQGTIGTSSGMAISHATILHSLIADNNARQFRTGGCAAGDSSAIAGFSSTAAGARRQLALITSAAPDSE